MDKQIKDAVKQALQFYGLMLVVGVIYCYMLYKFGIPFIRWVYGHFN